MLNHCYPTSGKDFQKRHDDLQHRLVKALPRRYALRINRTLGTGRRTRPDLVILDPAQKAAFVVDVTVPFENGKDAFLAARAEKVRKYEEDVAELRAMGYRVYVDAFIVGTLGTWDPANNILLRHLRIRKNYLPRFRDLCCATTLETSTKIFRQHAGWDKVNSSVSPAEGEDSYEMNS